MMLSTIGVDGNFCDICRRSLIECDCISAEEAQRAYDEAVPVPMSKEEINRIVEYAVTTCPRCEGTGKYQHLPITPIKDCSLCNGTGKIQ